ncbi:MAG: methylmalonyl Co-A mutase-associated GTPase MeaB [Synergistaceae bacterium]|jgi:LAO/AO transport system kinase|nr:methylmalonyl Co-A mutase-associated GTPase MeaB [Synergistaceae bacterium]
MSTLAERATAGDVRAMARLISMAEDRADGIDSLMKELYPRTGRAWTIGVTGSPGAGKSTLTDKLIGHFRSKGSTVGVLAVDPSSPYTGGAILADRLRMQRHTDDDGVFMRSLGARGSLGGLSRGTREGVLILDACGYDIVIIETVGVGQSEIDVMRVADTVCVVLVPGLGDDIQAMKAGIMEIADLFVVNKADRPGADRLVHEVRGVLEFLRGRDWVPTISQTVAETGDGVAELGERLLSHREYSGKSGAGRERELARLKTKIEEIMLERLSSQVETLWTDRREELLEAVHERRLDPYTVAEELLSRA